MSENGSDEWIDRPIDIRRTDHRCQINSKTCWANPGYPGILKNWLTVIGKKHLIKELSHVESLMLVYDAAKRPVSEFVGT